MWIMWKSLEYTDLTVILSLVIWVLRRFVNFLYTFPGTLNRPKRYMYLYQVHIKLMKGKALRKHSHNRAIN